MPDYSVACHALARGLGGTLHIAVGVWRRGLYFLQRIRAVVIILSSLLC
jgi:hypothetical protein